MAVTAARISTNSSPIGSTSHNSRLIHRLESNSVPSLKCMEPRSGLIHWYSGYQTAGPNTAIR